MPKREARAYSGWVDGEHDMLRGLGLGWGPGHQSVTNVGLVVGATQHLLCSQPVYRGIPGGACLQILSHGWSLEACSHSSQGSLFDA